MSSTQCILWIWLCTFPLFWDSTPLFFFGLQSVCWRSRRVCPVEFLTVWSLLLALRWVSVPFILLLQTVRSRSLIKFRSNIVVETLPGGWRAFLSASHREVQNQVFSLWLMLKSTCGFKCWIQSFLLQLSLLKGGFEVAAGSECEFGMDLHLDICICVCSVLTVCWTSFGILYVNWFVSY